MLGAMSGSLADARGEKEPFGRHGRWVSKWLPIIRLLWHGQKGEEGRFAELSGKRVLINPKAPSKGLAYPSKVIFNKGKDALEHRGKKAAMRL